MRTLKVPAFLFTSWLLAAAGCGSGSNNNNDGGTGGHGGSTGGAKGSAGHGAGGATAGAGGATAGSGGATAGTGGGAGAGGSGGAPDPIAARGQYLVTSVLGCTGCHNAQLSGTDCFVKSGTTGCLSSANLTNDASGLAGYTDKKIKDAFTKGIDPEDST